MSSEKPFRPLLAATIDSNEQLDVLSYPLVASPKVDGIRCIVHPQMGPITRSCKPIRNDHIRSLLHQILLWGLDGEIISGNITAKDVFNRTTSAVMTQSGTPEFTYWVFDLVSIHGADYNTRLHAIERRANELAFDYVRPLPYRVVTSPQEVLEAEIEWLGQGFEGIMLRHPLAKYKYGRSTLREQILMKLKRFADDEATIVGFEELYRNENEPVRNLMGLQERSSHNAGKKPAGILGNLIVENQMFGQFAIGSGFDISLRTEIWENRPKYLGRLVTYKYQKIGIVDKPRFPIYLRFRGDE